VKISNAANDKLINRPISLWQSRYERDLSPVGAQQIVENVTGLFSILNEWARAETLFALSDNRKPRGSQGEVCDNRDTYDAQDDISKSVAEGFRAIRERKAAGGPGWGEPSDYHTPPMRKRTSKIPARPGRLAGVPAK
jgi:hypothetical protein